MKLGGSMLRLSEQSADEQMADYVDELIRSRDVERRATLADALASALEGFMGIDRDLLMSTLFITDAGEIPSVESTAFSTGAVPNRDLASSRWLSTTL